MVKELLKELIYGKLHVLLILLNQKQTPPAIHLNPPSGITLQVHRYEALRGNIFDVCAVVLRHAAHCGSGDY
jgi:hypothetical protein